MYRKRYISELATTRSECVQGRIRCGHRAVFLSVFLVVAENRTMATAYPMMTPNCTIARDSPGLSDGKVFDTDIPLF